MSEFAVTFSSRHPEVAHPLFQGAHRDGFLVIEARDDVRAREIAFSYLGPIWARVIPINEALASNRYPLGELGRIGLRVPGEHLVDGFCPECGLRSLKLEPSGAMVCISPDCANPRAAAQILSDPEVEHIVVYADDDLTVKHPLRERLDDGLFACRVLGDLASAPYDGPPATNGTYRVTALAGVGYEFEAVT